MFWYMIHNCPINCLFAAELLLAFGSEWVSQSLSRCPLFSPSIPHVSVLYLPSCSLCLCTGSREQQSHHRHLDERWSHHQPSPIATARPQLDAGRARVLCYHDNHFKLVKVWPVETSFFCFLFFYDSSDMLIYQPPWQWCWEGVAGEEGE